MIKKILPIIGVSILLTACAEVDRVAGEVAKDFNDALTTSDNTASQPSHQTTSTPWVSRKAGQCQGELKADVDVDTVFNRVKNTFGSRTFLPKSEGYYEETFWITGAVQYDVIPGVRYEISGYPKQDQHWVSFLLMKDGPNHSVIRYWTRNYMADTCESIEAFMIKRLLKAPLKHL